MAIRREISVLNEGVTADIDIVYGSDLVPIEFYITDYALPTNAIATIYCTTSKKQLFKKVGAIANNIISFVPEAGFFSVGKNVLQIRITAEKKNLYSFEMKVNCKSNMASDDAQEVESQQTLVERLLTEVGNLSKALSDEITERKSEDEAEMAERSHIGLIVQSTTLDTEEKVINLYGGIRWELIQGRFLLGKSDEHPIGTTGGEEKHTLTEEEMPTHKHSGKTGIAETNAIRVVSLAGLRSERNHITGFGDGTYADINDIFPGQNHWHSFETSNVGNNAPHNNMPPYKTVYIWERVE